MSELVLIASDLYWPPSGLPRASRGASLPYLSRIARFGAVELLPYGWRRWLAGNLGAVELATASPAAIAAAAGRAGDARETSESVREFVWLADPVHLVAGLTSLHLAPRGILALEPAVQEALCSAFNDVFAEAGFRLAPVRGGRFLAQGPAPAGDVRTTEPARVLGSTIEDALPQGTGASALLALGAEIEMWLHEHPINLQRARERQPPISTLWLWGGGTPLESAADRRGTKAAPEVAIFGDDVFMEGMALLSGARFAGAARGFASLEGADAASQADVASPADAARRAGPARRVVALELFRGGAPSPHRSGQPLEALATFEREWVAPALEQLRRGELSRLTVVANDRRLSIASGDRLKVWRRRRAALEALL